MAQGLLNIVRYVLNIMFHFQSVSNLLTSLTLTVSQWDHLDRFTCKCHANINPHIWTCGQLVLRHGMPKLMGVWYSWFHKKEVEINYTKVLKCWVMSRMWVLYQVIKSKQRSRGVVRYFIRPIDHLVSWPQLYDGFHLVGKTIGNYRV